MSVKEARFITYDDDDGDDDDESASASEISTLAKTFDTNQKK